VYPNAKLGVIGEGSSEIKIDMLKIIKKFNLENNVILLGYLQDKDAAVVLKSSKIFLFPSHEEGWGIAVAEAMAAELPVVSWDLPVYKEVFENYTIRVDENNIESFSVKVIGLLKDDGKRVKSGIEGYQFIHKYSWDKVTEEEKKIFSHSTLEDKQLF
jgi:glycosyltransferase involved in cell wall biosynthesis